MITLILEARRIPNETKVRKITGELYYTLKRELNVYMPKGTDNFTIKTKDVVFLVSDHSINGYPDTTKFAMDVSEQEAHRIIVDCLKETE